jgi:hypothetical protein
MVCYFHLKGETREKITCDLIAGYIRGGLIFHKEVKNTFYNTK